MIIQGSAIDGGTFDPEHYLEVKSRLSEGPSEPRAEPWPLNES